MNGMKTMTVLFAGIAIGAAMGAFMAPEKGADLREKLAGGLKKKGKHLFNSVKDTINEATNSVKSEVGQMGSNDATV